MENRKLEILQPSAASLQGREVFGILHTIYSPTSTIHSTWQNANVFRYTSSGIRVTISFNGFLSNEKYTIKDVNANMEADEEALTRMISTALRHGAAIDFIVDQLNKSHGSVVSFAKAISRTLAKYSKPIISKEKCTDCGSTNTRKEEGCSKCLDCGSSKCG